MKFVRSTILVAAATAVTLIPAAAQADGSGHSDATGDVQSVVVDGEGNVADTTATPEPTTTLGDITTVRAANGARNVKVVLHFAELNQAGDAQVHSVLIATQNMTRIAIIQASPGHWGGKAILTNMHGKKVSCTVRHRIDYDLNKVVVKVPRSCLGQPKVIKVGSRSLIGEGTKLFYDDAYTIGGSLDAAYGLSPRIHR